MKFIFTLIAIFNLVSCNISRSENKDAYDEFDKNVSNVVVKLDKVELMIKKDLKVLSIGDGFRIIDDKGNGFFYKIRKIYQNPDMINIEYKYIDKDWSIAGSYQSDKYNGFTYRIK